MVSEENESTMPPSDEQIDFVDSGMANYSKEKQSINYKDIVLRAIENCRIEGSKEMIRGGKKMVYSQEVNDWIPITLPDQREVYKQAVYTLYDLLLFHFDETATKNLGSINTTLNNSYRTFFKQYILAETYIPYKEIALKSGIIQTGKYSDVGIFYLNQFEEYKFQCYRKMFQELLLLYKRKRELSNKRFASVT